MRFYLLTFNQLLTACVSSTFLHTYIHLFNNNNNNNRISIAPYGRNFRGASTSTVTVGWVTGKVSTIQPVKNLAPEKKVFLWITSGDLA